MPYTIIIITKVLTLKKVFLIPHAGGLSTPYKNLGKSYPDYHFEVLHFKGRGHTYYDFDKLDFSSFIKMAYEDFKTKIEGDFVLLGHSFGALIALELLKLYKKEPNQNAVLFIASSFTPPTEANVKNRIQLSKLKNEVLLEHLESLAPFQEQIKNSKEWLDNFLHHIRGDFSLLDTYQGQGRDELPYPILALCGDDDISAKYELQSEWSCFTTNDFELKIYPGKHFDLFVNQGVKDKIHHALINFFGDER